MPPGSSDCQRLGHNPETLARIHGPAGLSVGAVSPAEIAIAIMAQMTATLRQRPAPAEAAVAAA